jgi:hypothetical protein
MHSRSDRTNGGGIFLKTVFVTGKKNDVLEVILCKKIGDVQTYARAGSEEYESAGRRS